ncbi:hypothetical protein N7478_013277 [Penicillium angulare]|uniref:uncharacterized protein n=1 Tax=Penicillium angulare TaxID=116970 RepID=UPI00254236BA|nr:uncharacterized protein N7478_013277 [Penicillium angulare]KAJ5257173.1 hypothetical protein N7478_013277 [Penicillium angulare]
MPHVAEKYNLDVRSLEQLALVSKKGDSSAGSDPASEVFARVWCCHTGTNAVIWKQDHGGECCFTVH